MKHLLLTTIAAVLLVGCGGRLIAPAPPPRGIWRAADQGNIEAVKKHLDAGVDIHVLDKKYGFAPLHYAAEGGYNEIVELLIDKGANVNAKDENGATPQDLAIQFKEFETASLLRKHGGKHETIHSADVSDEDGSRHRNFVYSFLWFILGVMSLAFFIYIFVA